jgi:hypothetical protein
MSAAPFATDDEHAWSAAVQAGDFGVWDLRPELEAVHYSPRWKQRLGYPQAGAADHTAFWRCHVHPDDLEPMLRAMQNHFDGFTATYETRFRLRSNGSGYRTVLSRGRVVERNGGDRVTRVVGTMVDLTQRPLSPATTTWEVDGLSSSEGPFVAQPFHQLLCEHGKAAATERALLLTRVADLLDAALRDSRLLA